MFLGKGSYIWTLSPWPVTYQPQPYGVFKLSSVRFAISLTDPSSLRIVMIIISHKSTHICLNQAFSVQFAFLPHGTRWQVASGGNSLSTQLAPTCQSVYVCATIIIIIVISIIILITTIESVIIFFSSDLI